MNYDKCYGLKPQHGMKAFQREPVYMAESGETSEKAQYFNSDLKTEWESLQQGQENSSSGQQHRRGFESGRICSIEDNQAKVNVARVQVAPTHVKVCLPFIQDTKGSTEGLEREEYHDVTTGSGRVINANVPQHKHRDHVFLNLSYSFGSKITLSTFFLEVTLLGHEKIMG